jgi:hypothetical protein
MKNDKFLGTCCFYDEKQMELLMKRVSEYWEQFGIYDSLNNNLNKEVCTRKEQKKKFGKKVK